MKSVPRALVQNRISIELLYLPHCHGYIGISRKQQCVIEHLMMVNAILVLKVMLELVQNSASCGGYICSNKRQTNVVKVFDVWKKSLF